MEHRIAVNLIKEGVSTGDAQCWADLGAGMGAFTKALADVLESKENIIYAIDTKADALDEMIERHGTTTIIKLCLDFVNDELPVRELDGILMANSFHFVQDKLALIGKLKTLMKPDARLVFVEYDTLQPTTWIPYPINFSTLKKVMLDYGFRNVKKLSDYPSVYNNDIYSAVVQ